MKEEKGDRSVSLIYHLSTTTFDMVFGFYIVVCDKKLYLITLEATKGPRKLYDPELPLTQF